MPKRTRQHPELFSTMRSPCDRHTILSKPQSDWKCWNEAGQRHSPLHVNKRLVRHSDWQSLLSRCSSLVLVDSSFSCINARKDRNAASDGKLRILWMPWGFNCPRRNGKLLRIFQFSCIGQKMSNLQSTSAASSGPCDSRKAEKENGWGPWENGVDSFQTAALAWSWRRLPKHLRDATHFVLFISEWQVPTQGCGLVESFISRRQNGMPFRFGTAARGMSSHSW